MTVEEFEMKYECSVLEVKAPKKWNNCYQVKVKIYRPEDGATYFTYVRKLNDAGIKDINDLWDSFHKVIK